MFATAWSTFLGVCPPGSAVPRKRAVQLLCLAMQLATALVSELNVASVEVSVPFGVVVRTAPSSPVCGSARFAAMRTAFDMPYLFPAILSWSMNCANAVAAATVVRSLITTSVGTASPVPMAAASSTRPSLASTNTTASAGAGRYPISKRPLLSAVSDPSSVNADPGPAAYSDTL